MEALSLNLRHLRAVAETARLGSVSAAAQRVALSQPALTQAIAGVEAALGLTLFERRSDGMVATPAATLLVPRIDAALAHVASPRVTATQLRAFLLLADAGSYAGASSTGGLSQPSLHRAVGDLSIALRRVLVVRSGRGILMTEAGRRTARAFRLARAELAAGLSELLTLGGPETGRIAIGAMPLARARLLPAAVAAFTRAHPEATVAIIEGSHAELIEPLRDGVLDLLVGALRDPPEPDLAQRALFEDRPVVIGRAGHPLAGTVPTTADLARFAWIVAAPSTPLHKQWAQLFDSAGIARPAAPIECGSVLTIRQLLRASDQLTLLSPDQVALEIDGGVLAVLGEAPGAIRRTIGITTRDGWRPTALQDAFRACLIDAAIPENL